ncbi:MAG: bacteriohopanetetrol glucosamine biosynthesis glycosyltransferase HpnI [Acidobacteriota bacterium]|nr:bacteriohopanetetrol glucosamine biosynthesis glycosyltransferase HpnI [Acidobacteriota bacterium]
MTWLGLPALACTAYWLLVWFASLRRLRERTPLPDFTPPVSILKPVRGRDEHFYAAILSHAQQQYPEFEILFGVRDPHDPAWPDIRRLIAEHPDCNIRTVTSAPETPNGKVGVLIALASEARYPTLLVNDSDILVPADYLRTVVAPLAGPDVGMVTCLYRARGSSFPARFEALGIATDFVPSILAARALGMAKFALGSTMVFRVEQLREIGGFEAVSEYLADDYQLGARIAATGRRIVLANCPVETSLGAGSWRDVWQHQLRWSRTIRVSQGAGYAGSLITHAALWSLIALAAGCWRIALVCYAARLFGGAAAARNVAAPVTWWLMPFRDVWGTAIWTAGLAGRHVEWRGQRLKLRSDGRISLDVTP